MPTTQNYTYPPFSTGFHFLYGKNFLLTQFLTNNGTFRPYLHRINKTPSPNCNCPEKTVQTAHHLMQECSLWSEDRPSVLKSLPPHHWLCSTTQIPSASETSSDALPKHIKKMPKEIKFVNTPKVPTKH